MTSSTDRFAASHRVLDLLQTVSKAHRKLEGANYDLSRLDKHPNDAHKALVKINEANDLLSSVAIALREGFDV